MSINPESFRMLSFTLSSLLLIGAGCRDGDHGIVGSTWVVTLDLHGLDDQHDAQRAREVIEKVAGDRASRSTSR